MPIFRHGNCVINLSEGSSFRCIASRQCAEFYLCDLQEQKEYVISCQNGKLVAKMVEDKDFWENNRGVKVYPPHPE